MRARPRALVIASLWAAVAVAAMVGFFQGDWRQYSIPLALWGTAVFAVALRWQTAAWLRGGRWAVAGRVVRVTTLSCLGLFALCTVAAIGVSRLSGCPIIGDPTGSIDFQNVDSVPLIVYPEGVQVPSVRLVLEPGVRTGWGYLVSCGSARRDDAVWRTIGAEYAGTWVYCREVTRAEMDHRPNLLLKRGDLQCTPAGVPAGPP